MPCLKRQRDARPIAESVVRASGFVARAVGLLGRGCLPPGQALLIAPCTSIHTFGMRFALDVIFVDREWRVVKVVRDLKPWRFAAGGKAAWSVFELQTGWLAYDAIAVGDTLALE